MAGASRVLEIPTTWESFSFSVTTTAQEITSSIIDKATVMIQSLSTNGGKIYFGSLSTITTAGANAGGELSASMSAVLPLRLSNSSKLYVIGSAGTQTLLVSVFNEGDIT